MNGEMSIVRALFALIEKVIGEKLLFAGISIVTILEALSDENLKTIGSSNLRPPSVIYGATNQNNVSI